MRLCAPTQTRCASACLRLRHLLLLLHLHLHHHLLLLPRPHPRRHVPSRTWSGRHRRPRAAKAWCAATATTMAAARLCACGARAPSTWASIATSFSGSGEAVLQLQWQFCPPRVMLPSYHHRSGLLLARQRRSPPQFPANQRSLAHLLSLPLPLPLWHQSPLPRQSLPH